MLASTWLLLFVPLAFVVAGVIWYRQSMDARDRYLREEAEQFGRDEVETR